ncbi:hypothetical protein K488DRAFT_71163 [Vararia minispora EC-137]|uniref:Uncharacterized protein n=1 Tax=Vararia minispora EC-137 TaxID=1314806 RepID=A0ACB8QJE9_9AGAM|nr:hypothetical protein K488DRAFT_71163 [Vararia minispora EC-137]
MSILLSSLLSPLLWNIVLCTPLPPIDIRAPFFGPAERGGSMLTNDTYSKLGEPLNVIISGLSSPEVLTRQGFVNFARAIGFSTECMGMHIGAPQWANLGDGHGRMAQMIELREHFNEMNFGTCVETLVGGNHLRVYRQDGPRAQSNALFLAVSQEESILRAHTISPDGYNWGRDRLVSAAIGSTSFDGVTYFTTAENISGLLPTGWENVNHNISQDGVVKLLTVHVTERLFVNRPAFVLNPLFVHPFLLPQILLVALGVAITSRLARRPFFNSGAE